jgi:hypothetical protein
VEHERGYEYNAVLLAALFAITEQGPGRYSIDARAFPRLRGARLAVAQLAFALAGSGIATSEPVQADPEEPEALSGDITGDGIPARGRVPAPA